MDIYKNHPWRRGVALCVCAALVWSGGIADAFPVAPAIRQPSRPRSNLNSRDGAVDRNFNRRSVPGPIRAYGSARNLADDVNTQALLLPVLSAPRIPRLLTHHVRSYFGELRRFYAELGTMDTYVAGREAGYSKDEISTVFAPDYEAWVWNHPIALGYWVWKSHRDSGWRWKFPVRLAAAYGILATKFLRRDHITAHGRHNAERPAFALTSGNTDFQSIPGYEEAERAIRQVAELQPDPQKQKETYDDLLKNLHQLIQTLAVKGIGPTDTLPYGIPAVARAAGDREWVMRDSLALAQTLAAKGIDPTNTLGLGIPEVARAAGDREWVMRDSLKLAQALAEKGIDPWSVLYHGIPVVARVAGNREDVFKDLSTHLAGLVETLAAKGIDPWSVLYQGIPEVARVAGDREWVMRDSLKLAQALAEKGIDSAYTLQFCIPVVARVAGNREDVFKDLSTHLAGLVETIVAKGINPWSVLYHGIPAVARVAGNREGVFKEMLRDLEVIAPEVKGVEAKTWMAIDGLGDFLECMPNAWDGLVMPAIHSQKVGAFLVFDTIHDMEKFISSDEDIAVLREIITQRGVRTQDYLQNLILPCLNGGLITSLAEGKGMLRDFMDNFPYAIPEFYRAFRDIRTGSLSRAEQTAQINLLRGRLDALKEAIVSGNVTPEQESDPHFATMLYHVFPPAVTTERNQYMGLYRQMADHPEHLQRHDPGVMQDQNYYFRKGSYGVREGERLDTAAWVSFGGAVRAANQAHETHAEESPAVLGRDLMSAWGQGALARQKKEFFRRIYGVYRQEGHSLPDDFNSVAGLLAYKEFIGDRLRDIVQSALDAYREQDPAAYESQVKARLTPQAAIGQGLVKAVWGTLKNLKGNRIDEQKAQKILESQLKMFNLPGEEALRLLGDAQGPGDVRATLESLEAGDVQINGDKVASRIVSDLVGPEQAEMRRELFGDGNTTGKLEYRISPDSPQVRVRFHVTKSKAHAPVGLCEGVCTDGDKQLWDNPNFFQVAFFGEDGVSLGGMHVLIVEEGGKKYLALPGINPSSAFLGQVDSADVLEAALEFARGLATEWHLAGVWIPTNGIIHSNRPSMQDAIRSRFGDRKRKISNQRFSYNPHAYFFDEVFEIPMEEPSSAGANWFPSMGPFYAIFGAPLVETLGLLHGIHGAAGGIDLLHAAPVLLGLIAATAFLLPHGPDRIQKEWRTFKERGLPGPILTMTALTFLCGTLAVSPHFAAAVAVVTLTHAVLNWFFAPDSAKQRIQGILRVSAAA